MTQQLFHKAVAAFDRVNHESERINGRPMVNSNAMLTYIEHVLHKDDPQAMQRFIRIMEYWADNLSGKDNL